MSILIGCAILLLGYLISEKLKQDALRREIEEAIDQQGLHNLADRWAAMMIERDPEELPYQTRIDASIRSARKQGAPEVLLDQIRQRLIAHYM